MKSTDAPNLKKYPEYLQAVDEFFEAGFREGDIIPHSWLEARLGLNPAAIHDFKSSKAYGLDRANKYTKFCETMLKDHNVHLVAQYGMGLFWVAAEYQTTAAMLALRKKVRKASAEAIAVLVHTDTDRLSDAGKAGRDRALIGVTAAANSMRKSINQEVRASRKAEISTPKA
jgi:hypothetical protein